jgi:hypothetical protein
MLNNEFFIKEKGPVNRILDSKFCDAYKGHKNSFIGNYHTIRKCLFQKET